MSWLRLFPALAWAAAIFMLSSMSSPPGAPRTEWASLAAHAAAFGLLAFLLAWFADSSPVARRWLSPLRRYAGVWLLTVAYGASDEIHQSFVPGRHPDVVDLAADAVGAALALTLWVVVRRRYRASNERARAAVPTAAERR